MTKKPVRGKASSNSAALRSRCFVSKFSSARAWAQIPQLSFLQSRWQKTAETGWPEPQQKTGSPLWRGQPLGEFKIASSACSRGAWFCGKQKLHVDFHLFFLAVVCHKDVRRLHLHRITSTVIPLAYTTVFRTPHIRRG